MAGGIDWFRWHHGSVTDPKFQLVARKAGASLSDVLAVWAYLLEKASASEVRGAFGEIDCESVDCLFGWDDGHTASILDQMVERKLIAGEQITAWEKRQPKRERPDDNSAERTRGYRAKQRHVTPCDATQRHETPRGEESREEKKEKEKEPSVLGAERAPRPAKKCPASFSLTQDLLDWAATEATGVDAHAETAKFRDHTFKTARSDWAGTWRNWIRTASENVRAPPMSFRERDAAIAAARVHEMTGGLVSAKPPGHRADALQEVFDAIPIQLAR